MVQGVKKYRDSISRQTYHTPALPWLTRSAESKHTALGFTALIIHVLCQYTFVSIHCTYVAHLLLTTIFASLIRIYTNIKVRSMDTYEGVITTVCVGNTEQLL